MAGSPDTNKNSINAIRSNQTFFTDSGRPQRQMHPKQGAQGLHADALLSKRAAGATLTGIMNQVGMPQGYESTFLDSAGS